MNNPNSFRPAALEDDDASNTIETNPYIPEAEPEPQPLRPLPVNNMLLNVSLKTETKLPKTEKQPEPAEQRREQAVHSLHDLLKPRLESTPKTQEAPKAPEAPPPIHEANYETKTQPQQDREEEQVSHYTAQTSAAQSQAAISVNPVNQRTQAQAVSRGAASSVTLYKSAIRTGFIIALGLIVFGIAILAVQSR